MQDVSRNLIQECSVNTRWGKVKMCCRCSQPGHYANYCTQPNPALWQPEPQKKETPPVKKK